MKLKKCNAILGLLSILFIILHMLYNIYCYVFFYYNPVLKWATAVPLLAAVGLHACLGMSILFLQPDGIGADPYRNKNRETFLQRITAGLMIPLLFLHLYGFQLMQNSASSGNKLLFYAVIMAEIVFYAVVLTHVAVSFSKAFITLGWISSMNTVKTLNRIVYVICGILFLVGTVAIVRGQLLMFGV